MNKLSILVATMALSVSANVSAFGDFEDNSTTNKMQQGQIGINKQGQKMKQGQEMQQGQVGIVKSDIKLTPIQGQVGIGTGNKTKVTVEGDSYQAPKKPDIPAYAPDAIASPATAPCYKTWAGSGGGLGLFSVGASGYVKDHGCAFGEVARRAQAQGNTAVAEEALQHMMRIVKEEAGVAVEPTEKEKTAARSEGKFFTDDLASSGYSDTSTIGGGGFIH